MHSIRSRALMSARAGVSIVEVTIALAIVMTVLAGVSGAFITNLSAARRAENLTRGSLFLETVMEDLSAQGYADLLTFNGNQIYDQEDEESSHFAVTLAAFETEVGLLQIQAILRERRNGREIGRLTSFRSQR